MKMTVYPSYYPEFSCIASRCRHSCCIGWEIDIDEDTYAAYRRVSGALGKRLASEISTDGTPHFILGEGERCPFLNREGLCDLILSLGEDSLCEICREHPRFYTLLSSHTEVGLGLCCEEAARLVLTKAEPTVLFSEGEADTVDPWDEEKLLWRSEVFRIIQNRALSVKARVRELSSLCDFEIGKVEESVRFLLSLEILTDQWRSLLSRYHTGKEEAFATYMKERESEYEQFMHYLAYRYLAGAYDHEEFGQKTAFIAWAFSLVFSLGSVIFSEKGEFTVEDQIELVRLFSTELEYNEDNLYQIFDRL